MNIYSKQAAAYRAIADALETASVHFRELAAMQETTCELDTATLVGGFPPTIDDSPASSPRSDGD